MQESQCVWVVMLMLRLRLRLMESSRSRSRIQSRGRDPEFQIGTAYCGQAIPSPSQKPSSTSLSRACFSQVFH